LNVDVTTEAIIAAPVATVAAFASEPDNALRWYVNIKRVEWQTPRPIDIGSRFALVAHFLGKRLEYVHQVVEYVPNRRLVMRTADGPFPMETTYEWEEADSGTRMKLRNRSTPSGFSRIVAPFMSAAMRRANQKDPAALKTLLEAK
jgi:ligand-binding SRPBCC domain-containing protein